MTGSFRGRMRQNQSKASLAPSTSTQKARLEKKLDHPVCSGRRRGWAERLGRQGRGARSGGARRAGMQCGLMAHRPAHTANPPPTFM